MTNLEKFNNLASEFNLTIVPETYKAVWSYPDSLWATYGMYDKDSLNRIMNYNKMTHTITIATTGSCSIFGTMLFINFRIFKRYADMKENIKQVIEQWKKAQIERKKIEIENDFKQ